MENGEKITCLLCLQSLTGLDHITKYTDMAPFGGQATPEVEMKSSSERTTRSLLLK